jgi:hypothetical protein
MAAFIYTLPNKAVFLDWSVFFITGKGYVHIATPTNAAIIEEIYGFPE